MDFLIPWKGHLSLLKLAKGADVDTYAPVGNDLFTNDGFTDIMYKGQSVIMGDANTIEAYKKLLGENQKYNYGKLTVSTEPFWANKPGGGKKK